MRAVFILVLISLATVSVAVQAADVPKYRGFIKPITSPIVLRYRPFPKSPFTLTQQVSIPTDGSDNSNQTQMSGFIESQLVDGLLMVTVASEHEAGQSSVQLYLQYSYTQSGQFQGIRKMELNGKDYLSSAPPQLETLMKQMEDALKSAHPTYDKINGYVTGDNIYDYDLNMNIMNFEMTIKTRGVVCGLTIHEGRDALVVDYEGEVSLNRNSGSASGYMLLDVSTGIPILSEEAMSIPLPLKEKTMQFLMNETHTLKLPPKRNNPIQRVGGSVEERLTKLNKLLEKGLLTPDEAAAKRKEILEGL